MNDLHTVITEELNRITRMSPDECVTHARLAEPTADALEAWLVKVGYGTTDVSDPAYNAWLLLHSACDRATEIVCGWGDITECDGDWCYPLEEPYRHRVSSWTETLAELVTHPNPMVIAEHSTAIITGLPRHITEQGATHPAVIAAWDVARRAVEEMYPRKVHKYEWKRMSRFERQQVYAG